MHQKNKLDFSDFFPISPEEWKKKISEELKTSIGESPVKTSGSLTIQGFYTAEDIQDLPYVPAFHDHFIVKSPRHWYTSEYVPYKDPGEASVTAQDALTHGADAISFFLTGEIQPESAEQLLQHLFPDITPFHFYLKKSNDSFFKILTAVKRADLKGSVILSPSEIQSRNALVNTYSRSYNELQRLPSLKCLGIDASAIFPDPDPVKEVANSIALALDIADRLTEEGISMKEILSRFCFSFETGKHYLPEMAKLRAFRLVWSHITNMADASFDPFATPLHCITSVRTFTSDPYYNLLYSTTESIAAIVGGCDSLCVTPFNSNIEAPNTFSRRISRNVSLILKEEARMDYVNDPAGGAYAVEVLTRQIAEQAIAIIQSIEAKGGWAHSV